MKTLFNRVVAAVCAASCSIALMANFSQALAVETDTLSTQICKNISQFIEVESTETALSIDLDKVQSDIENLENLGILHDSEQVQKIVTDSDTYGYELSVGDYRNLIEVDQTKSDRITYNVYQDGIHNELTIYNDGRAVLDGQEFAPSAAPRRVDISGQTYWSYEPEYGTKALYKYKFNTEQNADVELTEQITTITVTVFTWAVGTAIAGGTMGIGAGLMSLLTSLYASFSVKDPTSNCVSYKAIIYTTNANSGYVNTTYGYCYRYDFTFYSQKNFSRYTYSDTAYKRIQAY